MRRDSSELLGTEFGHKAEELNGVDLLGLPMSGEAKKARRDT